jgi:hypothetical protein
MKIAGLVAFLLLHVASALAQTSQIQVDLLLATLNGRPVFSMKIDDISALLGRPTAVEHNRSFAELLGPQIHYHDDGLSFWMNGTKYDPEGRLAMMRVYFSKTWSADTKRYFQQFRGKITKDLNGDWRADKTIAEFAEFNPTVTTPEELERQNKELERRLKSLNVPAPINTAPKYLVRINLNGFNVNLAHDSVTRFLEETNIAADRSKK